VFLFVRVRTLIACPMFSFWYLALFYATILINLRTYEVHLYFCLQFIKVTLMLESGADVGWLCSRRSAMNQSISSTLQFVTTPKRKTTRMLLCLRSSVLKRSSNLCLFMHRTQTSDIIEQETKRALRGYFALGLGVKYHDLYVCLFVCLQISNTHVQTFPLVQTS